MSSEMVQYVLVDGSGYLFRAFYALPALTNPQGEPTGAIYGVVNMIRRLIKTYKQAEILVFFDPPGPTQRHDLYPEYKAQRTSMPQDLQVQIAPLHRILKTMGLAVIIQPGQEADDVIASAAKKLVQSGSKVLISTQDKDFAQLVSPSLELVNTMHNIYYDRAAVKEKYGVYPEQIVDYLALVGDSADNIPGVEKVGPKTALKWLSQYGSLQGIVANADAIAGKVGENLRAALPKLPLYKTLVTINQDLVVDLDCLSTPATQPTNDDAGLREQYLQLGFQTWAKEIQVKKDNVALDYQLINTTEQLQRISAEQKAMPTMYAITYCIQPAQDGQDCVAVMLANRQRRYLLVCHPFIDCGQFLAIAAVLRLLCELFPTQAHTCVFADVKSWLNLCQQYDVAWSSDVFDVRLMAYVLQGPSRIDLVDSAYALLSRSVPTRKEVFGVGAKAQLPTKLDLAITAQCLAKEADALLAVAPLLAQRLQQLPSASQLYRDMDLPLQAILVAMERRGVLLDIEQLAQQSVEAAQELAQLQQQAYTHAGEDFNLSSPKQLQRILYEKLALPVLEKTPSGQPSTNENALVQLAESHPVVQAVLSYRSLAKLKSTYLDALIRQADVNNRVHSTFSSLITATGRLSSQDPNLQNIPIRSDRGRAIRRAFVAPTGFQLLAVDYSQIELRIMAHMSADQGLLHAFAHDEDVHARTAADIFSIPPEQVDGTQRRYAKIINFGLIYGMSAFGLAKQLGVARAQAQIYMDQYFQKYPGVHSYMEKVKATVHEQAWVETGMGRRLFFPDIRAEKASLRNASERAAINAPMQGTAADLIKKAMLAVDQVLSSYPGQCYLVLQVHDELVFEIEDSIVTEVVPRIVTAMETVMPLKVPLRVTYGVGENWGDIH